MYLKFAELEAHGIKVDVGTDYIHFIPENHWSTKTHDCFRKFADSIPLTDMEGDEIARAVDSLTLLNAIRRIAR